MPSIKSVRYLLASCAACTLASPGFGVAQTTTPSTAAPATAQAPAPKPKSKPKGPEEIVVTATRSRTAESKTPISMEVLTGKSIAQKGITDIQSLGAQDSSVNYQTGGGSGTIGIRGIASENTTEVGDPSVPVGTDGFFLNRPYTYNESLYDVNRIEVLRGPQGTLFGRNATGGLINVVNNPPTKSFDGYQEFTIGDYGTFNSTGAVNIPISNTFQMRVAYSSLAHDGYRYNGDVGHGDSQDAKSARVRFAWEPIDNFRADVTLQYTKVLGTGSTGVVDPLIISKDGLIDNNVTYKTYGNNPSDFALTSLPSQDIEEKAVRWNLAYAGLPFGITATYLGGYDVIQYNRETPETFPGEPLSDLPGLNTDGVGVFDANEHPDTQNHEFRLSSAQNQRLKWQVGAFFFQEDNSISTQFNVNPGFPMQVGPIAFGPTPGNPNPNGEFPYIYFRYPVHTTSAAGYGQATYRLTNQINITGGWRYTSDSKSRGPGESGLPIYGVVSQVDQSGSWNKITWHAGVDYTPSNDLFIYAKADKGYKAGGLNNPGQPNYAPETVLAYEVGAKDRILNGAIRLNADAFYEDYSNQQLQTFVPLSAGGATAVLNAGSSKIYGVDLGARGDIGNLFRVDFSATYLHARFGDNVNLADAGITTAGSVSVNVGGEQLPQAPDLTLTAGVEQSFDFLKGEITPRFETKFVSSQYLSVFNDLYTHVSPHAVENFYLRYDDGGGRYLVEFYLKNMTNETVLNYAAQQVGQFYDVFGFDPPRTFGARLRVNF